MFHSLGECFISLIFLLKSILFPQPRINKNINSWPLHTKFFFFLNLPFIVVKAIEYPNLNTYQITPRSGINIIKIFKEIKISTRYIFFFYIFFERTEFVVNQLLYQVDIWEPTSWYGYAFWIHAYAHFDAFWRNR